MGRAGQVVDNKWWVGGVGGDSDSVSVEDGGALMKKSFSFQVNYVLQGIELARFM